MATSLYFNNFMLPLILIPIKTFTEKAARMKKLHEGQCLLSTLLHLRSSYRNDNNNHNSKTKYLLLASMSFIVHWFNNIISVTVV